MSTLRDQLISAGLIVEGAKPPPPAAKPVPEGKDADRRRSREELAIARQVRTYALEHQVQPEEGPTPFHFVTRKNRIRRLDLSAAQAARLQSGELAIIERPEPDRIEHSLVPGSIAEQVYALSARAVRFFNRAENPIGVSPDAPPEDAPPPPEASAGSNAGPSPAGSPSAGATPATASPSVAAGGSFIRVRKAPRT